MLFPKSLKKGAGIGLICPSSPITEAQRAACVARLEGYGFKVIAADNLTSEHGGYMADTGKVRGEWINRMFADPNVDAVFCARGGDASGRAVPYLDLDLIRSHPKPFVGYSDVTTFHLILNQLCGLGTFHGPMVSSNMIGGFDAASEAAFFEALTVPEDFAWHAPEGGIPVPMFEGSAEGILTGGNLSLLCASMGTPYEVDTEGKILFIEEVHEECYRVDRMVWQLRNAGKLQRCAGILLGQFTDCDNRYKPDFTWKEIFREALDGLGIPVMYGLEAGHGSPNMTLPLGALCTMDTRTGELRFHMERG